MSCGFVVLLMLISALLWQYVRGAANRTYDLLLAGSALSILETVSSADGKILVNLPHSALDILSLAPDDRVFYSITSRGARLTGQGDLPLPEAPPSQEPRFLDQTHGGVSLRIVEQSQRIVVAGDRRWVTVQVAQTIAARIQYAAALFILGLGGLAFVSLIGLMFVWLAIRTALRPLARIQAELERREPTEFSRLDAEPPFEVSKLISAINGFMARLELTRRQSETFMADVAHQTRTGLSALQGHLSMAADARAFDEMQRRLRRAEEQAARTTRLTNQLLSHAMVIHRASNQTLYPVDLRALLRALLSEMLRDTVFRRINVAFEDAADADAPIEILGDPVSLREAFRNVIENAVRHGPEENAITVRLVAGAAAFVSVEVEDEGPGLPPAQYDAVLERFQSLNKEAKGSGLGLAIVRDVVAAHGGALKLAPGAKGGLRVRMTFPAVCSENEGPERAGATRGGGGVLLLCGVLLCGGVWSAAIWGAAMWGALSFALPMRAAAEPGVLDVWSVTDRPFMDPVIEDFLIRRPQATLRYREFETVALHSKLIRIGERFRNGDRAAAARDGAPDLVISSAMDLQVDLVNRGYARSIEIDARGWRRSWSAWRSELFGFTFEPAAVIYNRAAFPPDALPSTHAEMALFIRENEERLRGRIGTYDIRASGVGYLLATQEARLSPQFFRTMEAFGRADGALYCCTNEMISRTARGEMILSLNVIGSYALAATREHPDLGVHFYEDFNPVMLRSAFVPHAADDPDLAALFLNYLLSAEGQRAIADKSGLLPIDPQFRETPRAGTQVSLSQDSGRFVPIRLSVGLLTNLDHLKKSWMLESWEAAVQDEHRR